MNFDELKEKYYAMMARHDSEWEKYYRDYSKTKDILYEDKRMHENFLLSAEGQLKHQLRDKIERDHKAWEDEWGTNGQKIGKIKEEHNQEIKALLAPLDMEATDRLQIDDHCRTNGLYRKDESKASPSTSLERKDKSRER